MMILMLLFLVSFGITMLCMPTVINRLKHARIGQYIQDDGPKHASKAQTPTSAGIFLVLLVVVVLLFFGALKSNTGRIVSAILIGHMLLGACDDLSKLLYKNNNLGLTVKTKLVIQALLALLALGGLRWIMGEAMTVIHIPIGQSVAWELDLGWLYYPFGFFVIVGASNAYNLSDGLDGLFAGLTSIACLGLIAVIGQGVTTDVPIVLSMFPAVIAGCLIGFLWFNSHPASVFLGDSGSLSIGATLACVSILAKVELLFGLISGVFVIETLSVMVQVLYYKITGGQRYFRMAPIHHHYELCGLHETKIVVRFWVVGLIFSVISICWVLL